MVNPIHVYGVIVRRPAMVRGRYSSMLEKVYGLFVLIITGLLQSTKALFTMLHWLPVDIMAKKLVLSSKGGEALVHTGLWSCQEHVAGIM